mmetsp:Transcript_102559/g.235286  ORF Transcript_102559/g.235286 Transcript_102559/m.235286 type:complete len:383 (+) Transcript_102559:16-1164(+)
MASDVFALGLAPVASHAPCSPSGEPLFVEAAVGLNYAPDSFRSAVKERIFGYCVKEDGGCCRFKSVDSRVEYCGQFLQGQFHGLGRLSEAGPCARDIYEGEFRDGLRHGQGKQTVHGAEEVAVYSGAWQRGLPDGPGTITRRTAGGEHTEQTLFVAGASLRRCVRAAVVTMNHQVLEGLVARAMEVAADVEATSVCEDGSRAIVEAAIRGDLHAVQVLLSAGVTVNGAGTMSPTVLRRDEQFPWWDDQGDAHPRPMLRGSALHAAVAQGHLDCVSCLLAAEADINARLQNVEGVGLTPVQLGVLRGHDAIVRALLRRPGLDLSDFLEQGAGDTALRVSVVREARWLRRRWAWVIATRGAWPELTALFEFGNPAPWRLVIGCL